VLFRSLGIIYHETNLQIKDIENADEAFMTATPFCMLPVTSLHKKNIGTGKRGPVFDRLLKEWNLSVGIDIEKQIKNFNKELENNKNSGPSPYKFK
jgi:branched-chain amino acid aminotransferase